MPQALFSISSWVSCFQWFCCAVVAVLQKHLSVLSLSDKSDFDSFYNELYENFANYP